VKAGPPADAESGGADAKARGIVVSAETAGLGNRLKSWVSAMRLSADARVHWAVTPNMPAGFSQLFANDCATGTIPEGARVYSSWRLIVLPEDEAHLPAGFATVGAGAHPLIRAAGKAWWNLRGCPNDRYRYMVFPKTHSRRSTRADARHLDLEYGRIPQYFRDVYVPLFRRIDVLPAIVRKADDWAGDAGVDETTVGVQVRTWRDDPRRRRKYHRPSSNRLLRLMEGVRPEHRFLVVSDDDTIVASLARRFGENRVMHYPRETTRAQSWQSAEGVVEDLIDLLLLAKTRRLFASYLSTFSEAAWWLGGASAEVSVF
jgi:hypothetical protein